MSYGTYDDLAKETEIIEELKATKSRLISSAHTLEQSLVAVIRSKEIATVYDKINLSPSESISWRNMVKNYVNQYDTQRKTLKALFGKKVDDELAPMPHRGDILDLFTIHSHCSQLETFLKNTNVNDFIVQKKDGWVVSKENEPDKKGRREDDKGAITSPKDKIKKEWPQGKVLLINDIDHVRSIYRKHGYTRASQTDAFDKIVKYHIEQQGKEVFTKNVKKTCDKNDKTIRDHHKRMVKCGVLYRLDEGVFLMPDNPDEYNR